MEGQTEADQSLPDSLSPFGAELLGYLRDKKGPVSVAELTSAFPDASRGLIGVYLTYGLEDHVEQVTPDKWKYNPTSQNSQQDEALSDDADHNSHENPPQEESEQPPSLGQDLFTILAAADGEAIGEASLANKVQARGHDASFFEVKGLLDEFKDLARDPSHVNLQTGDAGSSEIENLLQFSEEARRLVTTLHAASKILVPLVASNRSFTVDELQRVLSKLGQSLSKQEILLALKSVLSGIVEKEDYSKWRVPEERSLDLTELFAESTSEKELRTSQEFIEQVEEWLDGSRQTVIPSAWLHDYWGAPEEDRLTEEEAHALAGFLDGFGFGIEPDVRFGGHPSECEHVAIFREGDGEESNGKRFDAARLLLELGAAVASADGEVSDEEERRMEQHLEEALYLSPSERARLRAHLERRLNHPPDLNAIRRRASELPEEDLRLLGRFLVTIAAADGILHENEVVLLGKIYEAFGLGRQALEQDLDEMTAPSSSRDEGEQETDRGEPIRPEVTEEPHETGNAPQTHPEEREELHLDTQKLEQIRSETQEVAEVLQDVFEKPEKEQKSRTIDKSGLDDAHVSFLSVLEKHSSWPRDAFEEIAEEHGLMPGFAIEQINEVAFEKASAPLLEGEDPIEVNANALEALKS